MRELINQGESSVVVNNTVTLQVCKEKGRMTWCFAGLRERSRDHEAKPSVNKGQRVRFKALIASASVLLMTIRGSGNDIEMRYNSKQSRKNGQVEAWLSFTSQADGFQVLLAWGDDRCMAEARLSITILIPRAPMIGSHYSRSTLSTLL